MVLSISEDVVVLTVVSFITILSGINDALRSITQEISGL